MCIFAFKKLRHIRKIRQQKQTYVQPVTKKDFQILRCLFIHDIIYLISAIFSAVLAVYSVATKLQEQAVLDFLSDLFTFFQFYLLSYKFFYIYHCIKSFSK